MTDELPGYRTSSARRGRGGPSLLTAAVVVLVMILTTLAILQRNRKPPPQPPPTTPPPLATASPTQTVAPTVLVERSSEWVVALAPTTTPSPWPTIAPPVPDTPRPQPSPTPRTSECVSSRWSARQVFLPSAHVMIEIEAVNRCNRDLGPLELWFEITGWRQGSRIQSVRGHPFDRVRKGGSEIVAIGLPGSIDWYDEITVEVVD